MPNLEIQLLGGFRLAVEGFPITAINQPRLQSLLAYLLLHRQAPQSRQHLAFSFWPEVSEAQARNNFRQALYQLRRALPQADSFLFVDSNTVQWVAEANYRLDVSEFEAASARAEALEQTTDRRAAAEALQQAVSLYTGDLVPSCYDEWITPQRDNLRRQCAALLQRLVHHLEEFRDYVTALDYARRLLDLDPLNEQAHLSLMRLHALRDDRAGALRAYHDCVTILRRELKRISSWSV
jgi:DNA-binding SARP family transcriptional activator